MSTVSTMSTATTMPAAAPASSGTAAAANPLLHGPILATLVRLSLPNAVAMVATACVAITETMYVGLLGIPQLAGIALVFPMAMLQQMMSAGAMGGGVSSAVSRAMGAGQIERAEALARHAVVIGLAMGVVFTAAFLTAGESVYRTLGGRGEALAQAMIYSNIVFLGSVGIWLTNTFASIVRGTGNMRVPSAVLLAVAVLQIALGGGLGLGLAGLPRWGMAGIALGQSIAFTLGALWLGWFLASGRARIRLAAGRLEWPMFRDILKVGAVACVSPVQSVLTVLVVTALVSSFGTEALAGYGIGARLEFLLVPITFAIGVASVPMVGMAIGSGNVPRARRVAWTAGILASVVVGSLGVAVAIWPELWSRRFTDAPGVLASAHQYLVYAGPAYAALGLALALYFASLGSGKILGPVLAQTVRLTTVALGGWWLTTHGGQASDFFVLVGVSLLAYGAASALAVATVEWGPQQRA